MVGDDAVHILQVGFQDPRKLSAILRQPFRLAGYDALDRVEVGFQRALENVAAFGQLLDLAGDEAVDARAAFGQLGKVGFERLRQQAAVVRPA